MNRKYLLVAALVVGYFYWQGSKIACSTALYLVDGKPVCDTDLESLGYYYWAKPPGVSGGGYYHLSDFEDPYGVFPANVIDSTLIDLMDDTVNISANYNAAQGLLSNMLKDGAQPLSLA
jgi:hypothetical protein